MASANMLTTVLFALLCIAFSSAKQCKPLTISACKDAGYKLTAPFAAVNGTSFQIYTEQKHNLSFTMSSRALGSCSNYKAAVLCSLFLPQCVEGRKDPLLPCRSVCRDFASACDKRLKYVGLSGLLRGLCELLPEEDKDDQQLSDSKRRCFVPEGFKPSSAAGEDVTGVCHKITVPVCRSLRYNYTLLPNTSQAANNVFGYVRPVMKSDCSSNATSFYCLTHVPACFNKNDFKALHVPCRSFCRKFVDDCGRVYKKNNITGLPVCEADYFPDNNSSTGLCTLYKWPAPWPVAVETPTSSSSTGPPTYSSSIRKSTSGSTTKMPTSGSSTRAPTSGSSINSTTSGPNTSSPSSGPSTGAPTSGSTTKMPTSGPSTGAPTSGSSINSTTSGPSTSSPSSGPSTGTPTSGSSINSTTSGPNTSSPTSGPSTGTPTSGLSINSTTSGSSTSSPTSGLSTGTLTSGSNTSLPTSGPNTSLRTPTSVPHTKQSTSAITNYAFANQSTVTVIVTPTRGNGSVEAKADKINKAGIIAGITVTVVVIIIFALIAAFYYKRHLIRGPEATHQLVDMEDLDHPY